MTTDAQSARARLLEIIRAKADRPRPGDAQSSGKEADYYVDLRRISPRRRGRAARRRGRCATSPSDLSYDAVGGPHARTPTPWRTSMLHAASAAGERLDAFVVRKAGKAHGLQQRIEGPSIAGRRVLIVEDTTTTGASPLAAVEAAREDGATVVAVATIADRATGAGERISTEAGVDYLHAYSLAELGLD